MQSISAIQPRLKAPSGTCDTHMHIYDPKYPRAPTAAFDGPKAPLSAYLKVRERLGIDRTVIVQPSTYGKDNRCTLEAMQALGASARGVAVVDESATDAELERLTKLGIRGIRFHMLPGGALPWDILETMAARVGANPPAHRYPRHRPCRQVSRACARRSSKFWRAPAPRRERPHLGEALGAL
jgi:D-galactarolactone isomerase